MTSETLAGAAVVSSSYLSEVERGLKRPSTDILAKLARAFGMLPSQLLEFVETMTEGSEAAAFSLEPPRIRQEQARSKHELGSPAERADPGAKGRIIQRLLAVAQDLDDEDLTALLDLARHLLKKNADS